MRAFCAILLVGIVAYVQAGPNDCDHLAANVTEAGTSRTGDDKNNQNIQLSVFLSNEQGVYKTERVTPYKNDTPQNRVETCTAPTYGEDCAGVRYFRKLISGSQTSNSLQGVKFGTTFIGWNKVTKVAYEFTMTMEAVDSDDYIFQRDQKIPIQIQKHTASDDDPTNPQSEVLQESDIDQEIMKVLKSKFALNSYNEKGGYNLYVTCDEQYAWVTYNVNTQRSQDDRTKLQKAIDILKGSIKKNEERKHLLASKEVREDGFPNFAIEELNTMNFPPTAS